MNERKRLSRAYDTCGLWEGVPFSPLKCRGRLIFTKASIGSGVFKRTVPFAFLPFFSPDDIISIRWETIIIFYRNHMPNTNFPMEIFVNLDLLIIIKNDMGPYSSGSLLV